MRRFISDDDASVVIKSITLALIGCLTVGAASRARSSPASSAGASSTSTLSVHSEPAGAAVYLDGRFVGETPVDVAGVTAGDHRVRVVKDGFLENGRVVAIAGGRGGAVRVRLTSRGSMGPAQGGGLKIVVIEGEDAVNIVDKKTAVKPVVEVRDRNDLPVAGAAVTFTVGGKGATFARGAQTLTATTNAAGRAAVTTLNPVGSGAVQINVQATFQGQTATATITQTNYASAAAAARAGRPASSGGGGGFPTGPIVWSAVGIGGGVTAWRVAKRFSDQGESDNGCALFFPTSAQSVPAAGGSFSNTFDADCDWTATSNQPWLTLTGPTSGSSNSGQATDAILRPVTLTFTVTPNPAATPRTALITIAPRIGGTSAITITQAAGGVAGTFRGAAVSSWSVGVEGLDCRYSVTMTDITAALSGSISTITDARVSAKVTATALPECRAQLLTLQTHHYVLQSTAISGQNIALTFQPAGSNRPLANVMFRGTVSADNRSISGTLTWQSVDDAGPIGWTLTAPITLTVEP